jgi:hypothetical protein
LLPFLDEVTADDGGGPLIGRHVVEWDLGLQGLAVLAVISLGFGVIAGLIVGRGVAYRLVATLDAPGTSGRRDVGLALNR